MTPEEIYNHRAKFYKETPLSRIEVKQESFLNEYDPNGHKINDPIIYPNIHKIITDEKATNELKNKIVEIAVERVAIPLQEIIATKQTTHVCGNPVQFIDASPSPTEEMKQLLTIYKQGWLKKNMEVLKYKFVESLKITGEAAANVYIENGKVNWRVFSFYDGDILHPVFNSKGKLEYFGRSYHVYDPTKKEYNTYMEVWDKTNAIRYKKNKLDISGANTSEWIVEENVTHGYSSVPITYAYDRKGPCWYPVQDLIDKMEIALSQLFENNKSYAFRILFIKGGFEVQGDLRGQARAILAESGDADAKFLEKADVSNSFKLQLESTMQFIQHGSFIVFPPEIKSGDTPSVSIKVVYSPAWEKGFKDANFININVDDIVEMFKHYYGMEIEKVSEFKKLDIRGEIIPYIHTNEQEIIANINQSVSMGSISRETAAEIHPYSKNDEYTRILKEEREILTGQETPVNTRENVQE